MKNEIFIDLEWVGRGNIYLLSYAYNFSDYGQLYGSALNRENIMKLLKGVEWIFVYGPDIARMEKAYNLHLKLNYYTVNLLGIARKYLALASHRLAYLEEHYNIKRTVSYKENIENLYYDFRNPKTHKQALKYNMEDSVNLAKVKKAMFKEIGFTNKDCLPFIMKP